MVHMKRQKASAGLRKIDKIMKILQGSRKIRLRETEIEKKKERDNMDRAQAH